MPVIRIASIVEGHGEEAALPVLLRRVAARVAPDVHLELPRPIRVKRNKIMKTGELEYALDTAARLALPGKRILILLDANGDCPAQLAAQILQRARGDKTIRAVLAKAEYEAWFLAAASSLAGQRDIAAGTTAPKNPEAVRGAKEWLSARMPHGLSYSAKSDQPALSMLFDMDAARKGAPSFAKFWRDVASLLA